MSQNSDNDGSKVLCTIDMNNMAAANNEDSNQLMGWSGRQSNNPRRSSILKLTEEMFEARRTSRRVSWAQTFQYKKLLSDGTTVVTSQELDKYGPELPQRPQQQQADNGIMTSENDDKSIAQNSSPSNTETNKNEVDDAENNDDENILKIKRKFDEQHLPKVLKKYYDPSGDVKDYETVINTALNKYHIEIDLINPSNNLAKFLDLCKKENALHEQNLTAFLNHFNLYDNNQQQEIPSKAKKCRSFLNYTTIENDEIDTTGRIRFNSTKISDDYSSMDFSLIDQSPIKIPDALDPQIDDKVDGEKNEKQKSLKRPSPEVHVATIHETTFMDTNSDEPTEPPKVITNDGSFNFLDKLKRQLEDDNDIGMDFSLDVSIDSHQNPVESVAVDVEVGAVEKTVSQMSSFTSNDETEASNGNDSLSLSLEEKKDAGNFLENLSQKESIEFTTVATVAVDEFASDCLPGQEEKPVEETKKEAENFLDNLSIPKNVESTIVTSVLNSCGPRYLTEETEKISALSIFRDNTSMTVEITDSTAIKESKGDAENFLGKLSRQENMEITIATQAFSHESGMKITGDETNGGIVEKKTMGIFGEKEVSKSILLDGSDLKLVTEKIDEHESCEFQSALDNSSIELDLDSDGQKTNVMGLPKNDCKNLDSANHQMENSADLITEFTIPQTTNFMDSIGMSEIEHFVEKEEKSINQFSDAGPQKFSLDQISEDKSDFGEKNDDDGDDSFLASLNLSEKFPTNVEVTLLPTNDLDSCKFDSTAACISTTKNDNDGIKVDVIEITQDSINMGTSKQEYVPTKPFMEKTDSINVDTEIQQEISLQNDYNDAQKTSQQPPLINGSTVAEIMSEMSVLKSTISVPPNHNQSKSHIPIFASHGRIEFLSIKHPQQIVGSKSSTTVKLNPHSLVTKMLPKSKISLLSSSTINEPRKVFEGNGTDDSMTSLFDENIKAKTRQSLGLTLRERLLEKINQQKQEQPQSSPPLIDPSLNSEKSLTEPPMEQIILSTLEQKFGTEILSEPRPIMMITPDIVMESINDDSDEKEENQSMERAISPIAMEQSLIELHEDLIIDDVPEILESQEKRVNDEYDDDDDDDEDEEELNDEEISEQTLNNTTLYLKKNFSFWIDKFVQLEDTTQKLEYSEHSKLSFSLDKCKIPSELGMFDFIKRLDLSKLNVRVQSVDKNLLVLRYLCSTLELRVHFGSVVKPILKIHFDQSANGSDAREIVAIDLISLIDSNKPLPQKRMNTLEERPLYDGDWFLLSFKDEHRPLLKLGHDYVLTRFEEKRNFFVQTFQDTSKLEQLIKEFSIVVTPAKKMITELRYLWSNQIIQMLPKDQTPEGRFGISVEILGVRKNIHLCLSFDHLKYPDEVIHPTIIVQDEDRQLYPLEEFSVALKMIKPCRYNYITNLIKASNCFIRALCEVMAQNRMHLKHAKQLRSMSRFELQRSD